MRLLYTSDIHGIMPAYEAFAEELGRSSYDLGVLGGDLLEDVLTDSQIVDLLGIDPDELLDELPAEDGPVLEDWEKGPFWTHMAKALDRRIAQIQALLSGPGKPILFVLGNHDHRAWPESALFHDLHGRRLELGGWSFVGYRWANGDRPPEALAEDLGRLRPLVDRRTVLVTHAPPQGILDRCRRKDPSTGRLARIGLEPLRHMGARLHLFGHVHESAGHRGPYVNGSWMERRVFYDIDVDKRRTREVR